jgi:hypothetical protein
MLQQLPLPEDSTRAISVTLVPLDGRRTPLRLAIRVPKTGNVRDVIQALVQMCSPRDETVSAVTGERNGSDRMLSNGSNSSSSSSTSSGSSSGSTSSWSSSSGSSCDSVAERECRGICLRESAVAVADVANHRVFGLVPLDRKLTGIRDNEPLYVYQLDDGTLDFSTTASSGSSDLQAVEVRMPPPPPLESDMQVSAYFNTLSIVCVASDVECKCLSSLRLTWRRWQFRKSCTDALVMF